MPTVLDRPTEEEVIYLPPNKELPRLIGIPGMENDLGLNVQSDWGVLVHNDEIHTFDEVISILQEATGCSLETAGDYALIIHERGKTIVYVGERQKCIAIAKIIEKIQLRVQVVEL